MPPSTFLLTWAALLVLQLAHGLKFDLQAHPGHESASKERCVRNFVAKDTLVVVTATISGSKGDGQVVNMHVCTEHGWPTSTSTNQVPHRLRMLLAMTMGGQETWLARVARHLHLIMMQPLMSVSKTSSKAVRGRYNY